MQNKIVLFIFIIFFTNCGKKFIETKPTKQDVVETIFASGTLEADDTYNLVAQSEGFLTAVHFNDGDMVHTGQIMATIDNKESQINTNASKELLTIAENNAKLSAPLLQQALLDIQNAKQILAQDSLQAQRYKRLWESNSVSRVDFENTQVKYKTSKTNYETALENYQKLKTDAQQAIINTKNSLDINSTAKNKIHIKVLVAGRVYEKKKELGDYVRPGDVIAVIGKQDNIYAKLNIDESSILKIKLHQNAVVQLNTNKDKNYQAEIYEIEPEFEESSQSFIVKLKFLDPLDFKITKTQLQANIIVDTIKDALLIPRNFIDFGNNVMIKGNKSPTKVKTNFVSNQWVQVLDGINENTVLVTDNISNN
ncbi:MAG: HlyD family efflux transporter periplasmic adaptor subunit [Alphaproteobacteria bacterium]|nr:HlyD family efflux transporter periplasmic adaptor subunit [Alphaproteobacteria bacterium]